MSGTGEVNARKNTDELAARLKRVRAVVTDVDGCMTDGAVIYSDGRIETKSFDIKDGMGVTLARQAGLLTAIITGRSSHAVARRAKELGFHHCFQGHEKKILAFEALLEAEGLEAAETAYLGDDLLDLSVLLRAGVSFAPSDAVADVRERVDVVLCNSGGRGALREMIETVLRAKGLWDDIIETYL